MLPDIALEALRYFDRTSLEGLQMHSRYLRDLVNRHARTLALRYIHEVRIYIGEVAIQLLEDDDVIEFMKPAGEQELEALFHRLNNAFIHRLRLSFLLDHLPLPYYLRANADNLQCRIRAIHIEDTVKYDIKEHARARGIDYALVDFLGAHLKPQVYESSMCGAVLEDYAMLFTQDALRGHVKHLDYHFYGNYPVPDCIFAALFGVYVVETCALITEVEPRPWISRFIEMFRMADGGMDFARSVTLIYKRRHRDVSPLRDTADLLGRPRRVGVPAPHSAFIKEWSRKQLYFGSTTTESTAELFVFKSAKSTKKLDIYVWKVYEIDEYNGLDITLHYAFLLQVVDVCYPYA